MANVAPVTLPQIAEDNLRPEVVESVPSAPPEGGGAPLEPPLGDPNGGWMPTAPCWFGPPGANGEFIPASWGMHQQQGVVGYHLPEAQCQGVQHFEQWREISTGPPAQQAAYLVSDMYQQQQQQMMLYMAQQQQQQPYYTAPPAPVFAISPPQQPMHHASRQRQQDAGKVARKKKAALLAESSFGCERSFLSGDDASLLASAETSVADDDRPASQRASMEEARRSSQAASGRLSTESSQLRAPGAGRSSAQQYVPTLAPQIEFDREPRAVDWHPYSYADYRHRNYDAKAADKYWKLGGLGPAHGVGTAATDPRWQAQQAKRERQQQFGHAVRQGGVGGAACARVCIACGGAAPPVHPTWPKLPDFTRRPASITASAFLVFSHSPCKELHTPLEQTLQMRMSEYLNSWPNLA
jgi:hypothetical protein